MFPPSGVQWPSLEIKAELGGYPVRLSAQNILEFCGVDMGKVRLPHHGPHVRLKRHE